MPDTLTLAQTLLAPAKAHARIVGEDDDPALLLMLGAAIADIEAAAERVLAEPIPDDLQLAVLDQAALYFDHRGGDADRPLGLSLAASRIVARYRGVAL